MSRVEPSSRDAREVVPLFAALGDPRRLELLDQIATAGPQSIARRSAGSDVTRQAIAKHLRVRAAAGLGRGYRQGRDHLRELAPGRLSDGRDYLDRIASQWDDALDRLKAFVERE